MQPPTQTLYTRYRCLALIVNAVPVLHCRDIRGNNRGWAAMPAPYKKGMSGSSQNKTERDGADAMGFRFEKEGLLWLLGLGLRLRGRCRQRRRGRGRGCQGSPVYNHRRRGRHSPKITPISSMPYRKPDSATTARIRDRGTREQHTTARGRRSGDAAACGTGIRVEMTVHWVDRPCGKRDQKNSTPKIHVSHQ